MLALHWDLWSAVLKVCILATQVDWRNTLTRVVMVLFCSLAEGPCLLHTTTGNLLRTLRGPGECVRPRLLKLTRDGLVLVNYTDGTGHLAVFTINGRLLSDKRLDDQMLVRMCTCMCEPFIFKFVHITIRFHPVMVRHFTCKRILVIFQVLFYKTKPSSLSFLWSRVAFKLLRLYWKEIALARHTFSESVVDRKTSLYKFEVDTSLPNKEKTIG